MATLAELLAAAAAVSASGEAAADHVLELYQGEGSGSNDGCFSVDGVFDLCGNVEEWTRRRDGGTTGFSGSLKGRYWAESRTCQQAVAVHGDTYRFYELGFRCCLDRPEIFSDGFESRDSEPLPRFHANVDSLKGRYIRWRDPLLDAPGSRSADGQR